MAFFERPDPRLIESADPAPIGALAAALKRHGLAFGVCSMALLCAYAANVEIGLHRAAATSGSIVADGLYESVTIVRDRRGIPHIAAQNAHDLYFAQGYAEGSDRLFQLDLTRRYAYGRLAEIFGVKALSFDEAQRAVDVNGIAERQLRALQPSERQALVAFSDGVNAAAAAQPLPVEFRMLLYRPTVWTPKDSLAVSVVASLELADSWRDVLARDTVWRERGPRCFEALFPLSDTRYDVSVAGARDGTRRRQAPTRGCLETDVAGWRQRPAIGSNAWAAGGQRTIDGHAVLANDPHLDLTIPGIWYVVDLQSPQFHAAGATLPGIPGVLLGHNERLAWAATNANVATTSVFEGGRLNQRWRVIEHFHVRFSHDVSVSYYRTLRDFSVLSEGADATIALVRWPIYAQKRSAIATVLALDRASGVDDALRILKNYRGSPQNFVLADRRGEVAYHLAGLIPDDPAWGRYAHRARELHASFASIAFARLPGLAPSRDAILISANNKPYGAAYPYRLAAQFEPPYRAYRIWQLLRARHRYDAAYFARMQLDTLSPIDLEIARDVVRFAQAHFQRDFGTEVLARLRSWDGRYQSNSRVAAIEHDLRLALFEDTPGLNARLDDLREDANAAREVERNFGSALWAAMDERRAWGDAGSVRIEHPLAAMNFAFLNGASLPGSGDEYTIHLQEPGFAQGFRAVWDVGAWDRGGIAIPSGESGEPGSQHYTDLTGEWVDGRLEPLPFTRAAVLQNASSVLLLHPARNRAMQPTNQ